MNTRQLLCDTLYSIWFALMIDAVVLDGIVIIWGLFKQ